RVPRSRECRRDARRFCDRPPIAGDPRARLPRHRRSVARVRDEQGVHRAGRIVAPQPSAGSGGAVVPGPPGGLLVRRRFARGPRRPLQVRPLVLSLHRLPRACAGVRLVLPVLIALSPATHPELYTDWRQALDFCRALPDAAPSEPITFHMYWREKVGTWWPKVRRFGRKQALPVKAFFATQDLSKCSLVLWSDRDLSRNEWLQPFASRLTLRIYDAETEARGTPLDA